MPDKSKTFLIVGLGLIGGSYAIALHRQGFRVTAVDTDSTAISYALEQGMIDAGDTRPDGGLVEKADYVVFGLYPTVMLEWLTAHQHRFRPGTLLTDVSGVKRAVLYRVQDLLRPDLEFIGSHPMAGREVGGVQNADDSIFRGANFIVTPTEKNTETAIRFAEELGQMLGFSCISRLSPEEHDRMIGYLSQLTHAIAVSLMNANDSPYLVKYTGDSFRDLTRIAKINETLWSELFELNKDMLIPEIDSFIDELEGLKEDLRSGDREALRRRFVQSTERRKQFDRPIEKTS